MCRLLIFVMVHVSLASVTGMQQQYCQDSSDCTVLVGTTCQNSQCVCTDKPCHSERGFGEKCTSEADCGYDLTCVKQSTKVCRCGRGKVWQQVSKMCYSIDEETYINNKRYDITRDVIIPFVILVSLALTASLCYKLFWVSKSWRRRERANMGRTLEEAEIPYVGPSQPTTWIASYRGSIPTVGPFISVFGTVERSGPPCLLLPVGPPPYEEALKHKVILSSYQPPAAPPIETSPL